jgi:hypothetical protein
MASQIIPIKVPTYISAADYAPARVLPRLFYYNGLIDCETYYIESGSLTKGGVPKPQTSFPYFDNYNVVSGSFPTVNSKSLLFNNEGAAYGEVPTENLYTEYWETYINLLYNPKTRLIYCSAIIPLADYNDIELNDIVNFRGNYYHLRAINDYSIKTGECNLQLLGPIIADALSGPPPQLASSSVSWSYTESIQDGTFTVFDNATTIATLTANGSGNTQISESNYVTASLAPVNFPSTGSVLMSLNINGGGINISKTTSINETISASFLVGAGQKYGITGSTIFTQLSSSVSWSYSETRQDGTFTVFDNAATLATLTENGSGNAQVSQSHYVTASLAPVSYPSSGSVTMSLNINGATTLLVTGSTNTTISASFLVSAGQNYGITGSIIFNNSVVSGSKVYFDFGNTASYPGSGSTVTNLGSGGSSMNGTLVNSPTWTSTNDGILRLNNASSQRIDYSASITPDTTTIIIWKNVDSTFSKDTGVPTLRGNNGYMAAFLGGTKQFTPILFNTTGGGATFGGASVSASVITDWHQWAQTVSYSSPNTTAATFLDGNASSATLTQNFNRSGTGSGSAYIGFDNAIGDRYANGFIMAYLQYDRVLTTAELTQNYAVFSSRF